MSLTGTIYNIQQFSVHDGPGIRTTVFFKGCPLGCWWCHNPESRSFSSTLMNGKTLGKTYSQKELLSILKKDRIFYDQSGGGVTFSGGEPMSQVDFLTEILKLCKSEGIHTSVDTSGFSNKNAFSRILPYTDLFLYDIKLMEQAAHLKYTDVGNIEVLSNLKFLLNAGANVIIRIPLIPGITATETNLKQIIDFLQQFDPVPEVNLLPYHTIAAGKYEKLNLINRMNGDRELSPQEIEKYTLLFKTSGLPVKTGG